MPNKPYAKTAIPEKYAAHAGADPDRMAVSKEKILQALQAGNTRIASAGMGGITYETMRRWMMDDDAFADAIMLAEAVPERYAVSELMKAVQAGDLKAIMFWLERRRPMDWGRVDRVDVMVRRAQMEEAAKMLTDELGREVTIQEVEVEYNRTLKALPTGQRRHSRL